MEPMISLREPSAEAIESFLNAQSKLDFTYREVGATRVTPPAGYNADRSRIKLGQGEATFRAAKSALQNWTQFHLGWVEVRPAVTSIAVGKMVAVVGKSVGLWWTNACRIVYVIDDVSGAVCKYGYAYGTMPAHAGSGEELFLIEWNREDDSVWYHIVAFSKSHGLLAHLGYPWLRLVQRRFREQSGAVMVASVRLQVAGLNEK